MMTLFDQEYLTGVYVKEQQEEAWEEGITACAQSTQGSSVLRMHEQGCSADSIAKILGPDRGHRDRMDLGRSGSGIGMRLRIL